METNQLKQGGKSKHAILGVIDGTIFKDDSLVAEFQYNANDPATAPFCYPGGTLPINHDISVGDTSFGKKYARGGDTGDEVGFVAAAGLCWNNYCSQRNMEDCFYWQGIVMTDCQDEKHMDANQDDEHSQGYGILRAGTYTVANNGPHTFYPGDIICWEFPPAPFHPDSSGIFNNGGRINYTARDGVPPTQFRPYYRPFDPTEICSDMAGIYAAITSPKTEGGISDLPYANALPHYTGYRGERPWSNTQEEAIAYKYGLWGVALTLVQTLARNGYVTVHPGGNGPQVAGDANISQLATAIGLFNTNAGQQTIVHEGIADVLLMNLAPNDPARRDAVARFEVETGINDVPRGKFYQAATATPEPGQPALAYANLRTHVANILVGGMLNTWHSKRSKCVGRAISASAPTGDLDGLWGYFT